jgi:hypothetical protein
MFSLDMRIGSEEALKKQPEYICYIRVVVCLCFFIIKILLLQKFVGELCSIYIHFDDINSTAQF